MKVQNNIITVRSNKGWKETAFFIVAKMIYFSKFWHYWRSFSKICLHATSHLCKNLRENIATSSYSWKYSRKSPNSENGPKTNGPVASHNKGSLTRDFRQQICFINQCPPGPWVSHKDHFEFFWKLAEIFANKCVLAVSTTPAKQEKNFEINFFFIFYWELSLVHFTLKDWIFAYF